MKITYLQLQKAQIDYVELGLRQFNSGRFLGAHAFTTPQYLASIDLPKGPEYGVMVDAKTLLKNEEEGSLALWKNFCQQAMKKFRS